MATLAESFMADLADLSDDSAGSEDEAPVPIIDGEDLLVSAQFSVCHGTESTLRAIPPQIPRRTPRLARGMHRQCHVEIRHNEAPMENCRASPTQLSPSHWAANVKLRVIVADAGCAAGCRPRSVDRRRPAVHGEADQQQPLHRHNGPGERVQNISESEL